MKERIDAFDGEACGQLGGWKGGFGGPGHGFGHGVGPGFGPGFVHGLAGVNFVEAAADALGMEVADLRAAVGDGASLSEVAESQGVAYDDVKAAVLSAAQSALDEAVANGLSQERADAALERIRTWLDEGGQLPARPFGRHGHGNGWGPGGPFGG